MRLALLALLALALALVGWVVLHSAIVD